MSTFKCEETFLYEIIEDYKYAGSHEEQKKIFDSFCSSVWSCGNKRRTCTKTVSFDVRKDLLDTELGRIFNARSRTKYTYYKAFTNSRDWSSIIRQKINNLYTRYFDREVILSKEYMDLLKTPERLYYQWICGSETDVSSVICIIDEAASEADRLKKTLQSQKMDLSWNSYKKIIENCLKKCFDNCRLIDEYEDSRRLFTGLDLLTEDHFYTGYICRCLETYMMNYQKEYYHLKRGRNNSYLRCRQCSALIQKTGNRRIYCEKCAAKSRKASWKKASAKYRQNKVIK